MRSLEHVYVAGPPAGPAGNKYWRPARPDRNEARGKTFSTCVCCETTSDAARRWTTTVPKRIRILFPGLSTSADSLLIETVQCDITWMPFCSPKGIKEAW